MTASERKRVAKVLREWAKWFEGAPIKAPPHPSPEVKDIVHMFCRCRTDLGPLLLSGDEAATGLCLAAAMVEAGDEA